MTPMNDVHMHPPDCVRLGKLERKVLALENLVRIQNEYRDFILSLPGVEDSVESMVGGIRSLFGESEKLKQQLLTAEGEVEAIRLK